MKNYSAHYADNYDEHYLYPWMDKHLRNVIVLNEIISRIDRPEPTWLDLCCGPAWQFSVTPKDIHKTGLDVSEHQLTKARSRNPDAKFIQGNVEEVELDKDAYDLVTIFWHSIGYMVDEPRTERLLHRIASWNRDGGALLLEIVEPQVLASFNGSGFARMASAKVTPVTKDYTTWEYDDVGGYHILASPPLSFFRQILKYLYGKIEVRRPAGVFTEIVAWKRPKDQEIVC